MTTTTIADFSSSLDTPFNITVAPSSPVVGDAISISIQSKDDWSLISVYGALSNKAIIAAQTLSEKINISGAGTLSLSAPVDFLTSVVSLSALVNSDSQTIEDSAGSNVLSRTQVRGGTLFFDKENVYGTLDINYNTFRSLQWTHDAFVADGEYVLFATNLTTGKVELVTIQIGVSAANESSVPTLVTVQAKDFCTDLPIAGAGIYIDGQYKGVADTNGKLVVGVLNPGSYSLQITASGYIDTSADQLSNDSFKI